MTFAMRFVLVCLACLTATAASSAHAITQAETEAIYAEWLEYYADRTPELAIDMTSEDFIMVNNTTTMDRAEALAFVQGLAQFILSRECSNVVVAFQPLPQKSAVLHSRVDCLFQTVQGPLPASFLETIIVDKDGVILYDAFSNLADASL